MLELALEHLFTRYWPWVNKQSNHRALCSFAPFFYPQSHQRRQMLWGSNARTITIHSACLSPGRQCLGAGAFIHCLAHTNWFKTHLWSTYFVPGTGRGAREPKTHRHNSCAACSLIGKTPTCLSRDADRSGKQMSTRIISVRYGEWKDRDTYKICLNSSLPLFPFCFILLSFVLYSKVLGNYYLH